MLKIVQNIWQLLKSINNWSWAFTVCFILFASLQAKPSFLPAFLSVCFYFFVKYMDSYVLNEAIKRQFVTKESDSQ